MRSLIIAALVFCPAWVPVCALATDTVATTEAKKSGIKQCLPGIQALSSFLIGSNPNGVNITWDAKRPDQRPAHIAIETEAKEGPVLSVIEITPLPDQSCPAGYTEVRYQDVSCLAMAKELPEFKYVGLLSGSVSYLKKNNVNVYLMPAGKGCAIVRQQSVMDANKP